MLNKILSLVIVLLSIDVFIFIYNKLTALQLKSINRRIAKDAEFLEKDYELWTIEDVRSKLVIIIYGIMIIGSWVVHIPKVYTSLFLLLKDIFMWGFLFFLIYLNGHILVNRTRRIIQQLKGKF